MESPAYIDRLRPIVEDYVRAKEDILLQSAEDRLAKVEAEVRKLRDGKYFGADYDAKVKEHGQFLAVVAYLRSPEGQARREKERAEKTDLACRRARLPAGPMSLASLFSGALCWARKFGDALAEGIEGAPLHGAMDLDATDGGSSSSLPPPYLEDGENQRPKSPAVDVDVAAVAEVESAAR